jgi:membrane protein CcdC involved in cytochrome C biogenesis
VAETEKERVDRELIELLNEVRIVLPGVQVLFGFLLVVPFQQTFRDVTDFERQLFIVAFLTAMAASVFLIAPSSYHRIRFRSGDKRQMLETSNKFVLSGVGLLAVSLTTSAYLVTDYIYGPTAGALVALIAAVFLAWFWFGLPLSREITNKQSGPHE